MDEIKSNKKTENGLTQVINNLTVKVILNSP
jgi:hypothetical protein